MKVIFLGKFVYGFYISPRQIRASMEYLTLKTSPSSHPPLHSCCPKCKSTQITSQQKGYSGGKALALALAFGGLGLSARHATRKILITCQNCGYQWIPGGQMAKEVSPIKKYRISTWKWIRVMSIIMTLITGLTDIFMLLIPKDQNEVIIWTVLAIFALLTLMFISLSRTARKEIFLQKKENQKRYFDSFDG
jgi:hypothetical protein